jgi:hypothetical protein
MTYTTASPFISTRMHQFNTTYICYGEESDLKIFGTELPLSKYFKLTGLSVVGEGVT